MQEVLGEGGAIVAHVEQQLHAGHLVDALLHAADELRAEEQGVHVRQVRAILDLVGGVAVIHRHHQRAGLEDAKVQRQPLQTVHQQDGYLVALFDAAAHQQVGAAVGLFLKDAPGDLPAELLGGAALDQLVFLPGHPAVLPNLGIDLHQRDLAAVFAGILFQYLGNGHDSRLRKIIPSSAVNRGRLKPCYHLNLILPRGNTLGGYVHILPL